MRLRSLLLALLPFAWACAAPRAGGPARGAGDLLHASSLGAVRCLVVAPFENASDTSLAADAATDGVLATIDPARARVFPVPELRTLFRDTPLELPVGISPSLALELAELLGADAALYGAVEGRAADDAGEVLVTVRLALAGERRLLFAGTAAVKPAPGERSDEAVRRTAMELAGPALRQVGDPGRKRCFDAERTRALRELALAEAGGASGRTATATPTSTATPTATLGESGHPERSSDAPASERSRRAATSTATSTPTPTLGESGHPERISDAPASERSRRAPTANAIPTTTAAPAPPARAAAPPAPRPQPRTPRQAAWARTLGEGGRLLVEDLAFDGRTASVQRDGGLADLAVALAAEPGVRVRVEGFVDSTSDRAADAALSLAMARAAAERLVQLGVDRARVTAAGEGGGRPLLPNFTARGRAANRRVEVVGIVR